VNLEKQMMELRILLAGSVSDEDLFFYTARLKELEHIKKVSNAQELYEPLCDYCEYKAAEIFHADGDFCLECWQKHTYPDIQSRMPMNTATALATTMPPSSYIYRAVLSLDNKPIGYVTGLENDSLMIITDNNTGNEFIIPTCKVISVDTLNSNSLILDIEQHESTNYSIIEEKAIS
jgi:hypothetical protein